ncbi:MAG TPA: MoaD/ThiS family protein [Anaerolineaceae bacterium]|jgi:sulfur carrier protein ThiS
MVKFILRGQEYETRPNQTLNQSLKSLNMQPEAYLAVLDGELITGDQVLRTGQTVKLVAVVSGGSG